MINLLDKLKFELEKRNGFKTENLVIGRVKYTYEGKTEIGSRHIFRRCLLPNGKIYFEKLVKSNTDKTIYTLLPCKKTVINFEFFDEVFPGYTKVSFEDIIKLDSIVSKSDIKNLTL